METRTANRLSAPARLTGSRACRRLIVYTHPACLRHDPGEGHPEAPARLRAVTEALRAQGGRLDWRQAPPAPRTALQRVHAESLLREVLDRPAPERRWLDGDTAIGPGSPEAALHAAGAAVAAVDAVVGPDARAAFCAVRPPGHHATADTAMGFCLLNPVAVAAAHALHVHRLERVAIADFDAHHGNGTQAIFAAEPRVAYFSSHQSGIFPLTGSARERGLGNLHNAPLTGGSGGLRFRDAWHERLLPALEAFRPQLVLVSAGFDAHRLDPLADLMLEAEDFGWITAALAGVAGRHAGGRIVSVLEGGYHLDALRECVVAHAEALRGG